MSNLLNPLQVNSTVLYYGGIRYDIYNSFLVSGRQNIYYVRIPATTSNSRRKKRAVHEILEQTSNPEISKNGLAKAKSKTSISVLGIGIRFGSASSLTVIPLSLSSTTGSGMRSITLSDGSVLYEIKASAPSGLCSVSSSSCTSLDWTAYAIFNDGTAAAGPSTTVYASCGDQCSFGSSSTCSQMCQGCTYETVSGQDTPVSRQFYMGKSMANITFQYQTYGVKDRITVVYENNIIFDSDCVSSVEIKSLTVTFSGQSAEIRIDVEPNCDGTLAYADWKFTIGCPSLALTL